MSRLVSIISRPTLLTRFRERKQKVAPLCTIPRHLDTIRGSVNFFKFEPIQVDRPFTVCILPRYHRSFNESIGLDEASCAGPWSRPYFIAPFNFIYVVDHCSVAELSHPNALSIALIISLTRGDSDSSLTSV